jgi:acetyl esterase
MPLDPHAKRLLDMLATASPTAALPASVSARRESFRKLMSLFGSHVPIGRIEDRALPVAGGVLSVRVYTPIVTTFDPLPGMIFFHGGGLVAGSLNTHDGVCRTLANETGCRVISVNYRLAPEHRFPTAVLDAYAATLSTVEWAAELGIRRDRIVVAGDSAGATLAAIVCQLARDAHSVDLAAQLLLCPITDFCADTKSRAAFAEGYLLHQAAIDQDLEHYLPAGHDPRDPLVSPLRASDLQGLPPAYVHTAEFDPLRDEGRAYADALTRAGVKTAYTCHPGMVHLFYGMAVVIPYARAAMRHIGAEIRTALG